MNAMSNEDYEVQMIRAAEQRALAQKKLEQELLETIDRFESVENPIVTNADEKIGTNIVNAENQNNDAPHIWPDQSASWFPQIGSQSFANGVTAAVSVAGLAAALAAGYHYLYGGQSVEKKIEAQLAKMMRDQPELIQAYLQGDQEAFASIIDSCMQAVDNKLSADQVATVLAGSRLLRQEV